MLFFFNDTATTEIYTLSLHDALPICAARQARGQHAHGLHRDPGELEGERARVLLRRGVEGEEAARSEEHTSELQSRQYLVCRLLLEKKKTQSSAQCLAHSLFHFLRSL